MLCARLQKGLGGREIVQEMGFSPNDLVFGHMVRDPLALLQDNWREAQPPQNLFDYIEVFRYRLYKAQEVARRKLASAQVRVKKLYDPQVENHIFSPEDQVLALLPIVTSSLFLFIYSPSVSFSFTLLLLYSPSSVSFSFSILLLYAPSSVFFDYLFQTW